jgi:hypothetical protein
MNLAWGILIGALRSKTIYVNLIQGSVLIWVAQRHDLPLSTEEALVLVSVTYAVINMGSDSSPRNRFRKRGSFFPIQPTSSR